VTTSIKKNWKKPNPSDDDGNGYNNVNKDGIGSVDDEDDVAMLVSKKKKKKKRGWWGGWRVSRYEI
jgi:hypothetical protein